MTENNVELSIETTNELCENDIVQRHKQERKDLQGKIQSLKKSVTKGDKKRKKDIAEEIQRLEKELTERHANEMSIFKPEKSDETESIDESIDEEQSNQPKISRAAKRRMKKAQEEKEREQRILEQAEKHRDGPRIVEMVTIRNTLKNIGLQLHDIAADGNCLYCAVNHQLEAKGRESFTVTKLRKMTADFMREHKEDFLPFIYNENEEVNETFFEDYCKEIATTKRWGGQLELQALSNILKCPIKVIQASGPPTVQGDTFEGPELTLTYHRHLYRLGEHYNSTIALDDAD